MKDIAIYGAGGLGREVACLLHLINKKMPTWNLIGFFDDVKKQGDRNEYGQILGGLDVLNEWSHPISLVMAIGSPAVASKIVSKISLSMVDYPNIIAPDVSFLDRASISLGKGNIISLGCIISCNVKIGDFNLFNYRTSIAHDVEMRNFNMFMPSVNISGNVNMGDCNFFGVSSVVLQNVKVGNGIKLSANSLLITARKDNVTYMGNPAKVVNL